MQILTITEAAAQRIQTICKESDAKEIDSLKLRIAVQGGGCSGFQYTFVMDTHCQDDDFVFSHKGAHVVIDSSSLSLLEGSILDYQDDLAASMFVIKNPNAVSGCGCGHSFSI